LRDFKVSASFSGRKTGKFRWRGTSADEAIGKAEFFLVSEPSIGF